MNKPVEVNLIYRTLTISFILASLLFFPNISRSQSNFDSEYEISVKALNLIKIKDIKGLKELIDKKSLKRYGEQGLVEAVNEMAVVLNAFELPTRDLVSISTADVMYMGKAILLHSINFPFPSLSDENRASEQWLVILFSKDIKKKKIIGFKIKNIF